MQDTMDMDTLFLELEKDLRSLEEATAQSLGELDSDASAALSRWLGDWKILDDFGPDYVAE